jgi:hypothetical protein
MRVKCSAVPIRLTCDRSDGGGAQLHGRISTIAFARTFGLNYVHTPITEVHITETRETSEKWNSLLDFSIFGEAVEVESSPRTPVTFFGLILLIILGRAGKQSQIYQVDHCHFFTDRFPSSVHKLRNELRAAFFRKNANEPQEEVVLHIRSQMASEDTSFLRLSDKEAIERKILIAKSIPHPCRILGVSIGVDAIGQGGEGISIEEGLDAYDALRAFVQGSVFIMAKSSLSYVAGLLNPNTVFYEAHWHPRMPDWIPIDKFSYTRRTIARNFNPSDKQK